MSGKPSRRRSSDAGARSATCGARGADKRCAPINESLIFEPLDGSVEAYAACSCGRRFPLSWSARARLLAHLPTAPLLSRERGTLEASAFDRRLALATWPADRVSQFAKQGVVPVGTPVLHAPAEPVPLITKGLVKFGLHMTSVMRHANGIGLAANQVGVPIQVLIHKLSSVAPGMLINPKVLRASGSWQYTEGCLSLNVEDTAITVRRPKQILVRAATIDGKTLVVNADELFARVLQHEIDHLDGIEYVQRLTGQDRSGIYQVMSDRGIDVTFMPPRPYDDSLMKKATNSTPG